ncbi:MAG TPA: dihydropteroate synthase [Anaeromyxobacteraceae bacterium]|nr:dihydropteroate synthase [Anaeromyxobacteraceae bacterium]
MDAAPSVVVGGRTFGPPGAYVVGVVNVTPDSFSDGGRFLDPEAAVDQALRLVSEGADLVDVGGESTRPGASEVGAREEIGRVVPVLERLAAARLPVPVSVDTSKPEVARAALDAGAAMVNDVRGLADPELRRVVAEAGVPVVLMHMRGTPRDMRERAVYRDLLGEVRGELADAIARAEAAGVARERIVVDPGIGFAKTAEQSVELLARLPALASLGRPLYVGPSRKSFIGALTGAAPEDRLAGTLAAVTASVLGGATFVRVHDVAAARQAVRVALALRASGGMRAGV